MFSRDLEDRARGEGKPTDFDRYEHAAYPLRCDYCGEKEDTTRCLIVERTDEGVTHTIQTLCRDHRRLDEHEYGTTITYWPDDGLPTPRPVPPKE